MNDYTNIGAVCSDCARKAGFVKRSDALHCAKAKTHANGLVYGADICEACLKLFDKRFRADGWHLTYKEQGDMK